LPDAVSEAIPELKFDQMASLTARLMPARVGASIRLNSHFRYRK